MAAALSGGTRRQAQDPCTFPTHAEFEEAIRRSEILELIAPDELRAAFSDDRRDLLGVSNWSEGGGE